MNRRSFFGIVASTFAAKLIPDVPPLKGPSKELIEKQVKRFQEVARFFGHKATIAKNEKVIELLLNGS